MYSININFNHIHCRLQEFQTNTSHYDLAVVKLVGLIRSQQSGEVLGDNEEEAVNQEKAEEFAKHLNLDYEEIDPRDTEQVRTLLTRVAEESLSKLKQRCELISQSWALHLPANFDKKGTMSSECSC